MYRIIDPDAKESRPTWEEINKDTVTGNLKEKEIRQFMIGSNIIGICESFEETNESILANTKEWFLRDLFVLSNITKSRGGFLLKRITEQVQKVISHQSTGKKEIGND